MTTSERGRDQIPIRLSGRTWAVIVVVVVVLAAATAYYFVSRPDFVTRRSLEEAAPSMLRDYGPYGGPTGCKATIACESPTCHTARATAPFEFRSVCYFGKTGHFTVMFSYGAGEGYRDERGVFYRPDAISPEPDGICTRHVFGRWWEFAPLNDPNCPSGFGHYTGEA